jgi:hypothetical protein
MLLKLKKLPLELIIPILALILSFFIISPFGQFAVNDDWDFYTHVRNFRQGDFVKNGLIDSSFVLQGATGAAWSYVFGFNFVSLRFLTLAVTIGFIIGFVKLLQLFQIPRRFIVVAAMAVAFNPFVLLSSVTFMTENYFLCLLIWSLYFLFKYNQHAKPKYLILAALLGSLSILVRQIGLLLVPAIFISVLVIDYKKHRFNPKIYFVFAGLFIASSLAMFLWPQYSSTGTKASAFLSVILKSFNNVAELPQFLFYLLPYIGFATLPLGLSVFARTTFKAKVLLIVTSLILFLPFYKVDIFKFGNVLYPEALLIKTNYIPYITFFNNVIFKSVLCFFTNLSLVTIIFMLVKSRKFFKDTRPLSLSILFLALTIPVVIYDTFYDRYLVNGLVIMIVLTVLFMSRIEISLYTSRNWLIVTALVFSIYSVALVQDYIVVVKTQWKQADTLVEAKDGGNSLFLSNTYTKFRYVFTQDNRRGMYNPKLMGIKYSCYVQKDVEKGHANPVYQAIQTVSSMRGMTRFLANPKPDGEEIMPGYRNPSRDPDKIIYKEAVYSLPELLVGNSSSVVTYCVN